MSRSPIPAHRWILNLLRSAHIIGLVGLGAHMLAGEGAVHDRFALMILISGLSMVLLDVFANPLFLGQFAGLFALCKLAVVGWLFADPAHAPTIYWSLLVVSVLVAHAPARFRHRMILGRPAASGEAGGEES